MRVLSLGAGVQSTTVLRMVIAGELPLIDHAIFADVGWESPATYEHMATLRTEADAAGIGFHVVRAPGLDVRRQALEIQRFSTAGPDRFRGGLPYFIRKADGGVGRMRRYCTGDYKVKPVRTEVRRLLGLRPRQRALTGTMVEHLFGISTDEMQRMRLSEYRWQVYHYPLIEVGMSRTDCLRWHDDRGLPRPPRSSCIGCPHHSNAEWRRVREQPDLWGDAVDFDRQIRRMANVRAEQFLHRDCKPLDQVDLDKQQSLGFEDECAGMCGV